MPYSIVALLMLFSGFLSPNDAVLQVVAARPVAEVADEATATICYDLNGDGNINVIDIMMVSVQIGEANHPYDFDGDGMVDEDDLRMYAACWEQPPASARRVNASYFSGDISLSRTAVFWLGQVTPTENYADVRVGYNDNELYIRVAAVDRRLWYDPSPAADDLTAWDAVSVYLDLDGNVGSAPDGNAYRFVAQLKWWETAEDWQAAYAGDGSGFVARQIPFTAEAGWRGDAPNNDVDDRGWYVTLTIPFSSLGLSGPPAQGTIWGLAVAQHDRDDAAGTAIPDKVWPETMVGEQPGSWGQLGFGLPAYEPPAATPEGSVTIRHKLDGAVVADAAVGGHTTCGEDLDFWNEWGQATYAGLDTVNVQNQADIADWPCFSKYYVTFPLDAIPAGKEILSSTLTLHLMGNSGQGATPEPQPSLIQVLTIDEDWSESTLSWNNAPLALENVSRTWVDPVASFPGWPGIPYDWDVSAAVARAYARGEPLRLVLYSADGAYHSGKYFVSSDTGDWNEVARPTLQIEWGASGAQAAPAISDITDNRSAYPNGEVPAYEKFELTFAVDTVASNLQMPFDEAPPPGIEPDVGISVDALFTPDNWQTVYRQPAFYYQAFEEAVKQGQEWFYPTDDYSWKVRFAPTEVGEWRYRLVAEDAGGVTESAEGTFVVTESGNPGFVRVSADPRYFEFEDGSYFPGLGYNMNYDHISWKNPVLDNEANFQTMSAQGIQLVRMWLSQWGIFGPSWNPWNAMDPALHGQYIPLPSLSFRESYGDSEVAMKLDAARNACMFIGLWKAKPAVKRDADYRIRIRYKTGEITGPRTAGAPYGLVAKTGDWLWGSGNDCDDAGTGVTLTPHQSQATPGWQILEGQFNSGGNDFLPNFYLVLENAEAGIAFIDYVWIEEDLGNGEFGPNIVSKPWMAHHQYFEQRNSYAFDKVLELAERNDIYLRPVILEKNDWIFNRIDFEGQPIPYDDRCGDGDPGNDPDKCPGNEWFYGDGRAMTKVRWLQQAWWRYLQARWGYSPNIHSWELLNEGDPNDGRHYALADAFGAYMHQFAPNDHLVSTSFWNSFPRDAFWGNDAYGNVDFADIHRYVSEGDPLSDDTAAATYDVSMRYGAAAAGGASKPLIRGETGFTVSGTEPATDRFQEDTEGVWLHNFIWGGVNAGGMIESYWYETPHIYNQRRDGSFVNDHRAQFRPFYNFVRDIPLNDGDYVDAAAEVSEEGLRAWGQKDLRHENAHLWIQNKQHTWRAVVEGRSVMPVSGTVTLAGFSAGRAYVVEWWNPYEPDPDLQITSQQSVIARPDGTLAIEISDLRSDVAVKVRR